MDNTSPAKKEFSPVEKVAVLLASIDQKVAASIIQQLDSKLMVEVTNSLRALGVVPGAVRDKTIAECLHSIQEFGLAVEGDESLANTLLVQAIGEKKAAALLNENKPTEKVSFAQLSELSAEQIAGGLAREQPGIIAIVFKHIPAKLSAEVMDLLPSEVRRRVMVYMCTAVNPSEDVVLRIETLLNNKLSHGPKVSKTSERSDGLVQVAAILQNAKKAVEEDLLSAIQEKSEPIASELRDMLFTFEDVVRLSDTAIRRLMQEVDSASLALALRSANIELKQKFFQNMSKRAVAALMEEMQFAQKVRRADIESKQKEIVATIRTLEADGQLSTGASDDYI